MERPFKETSVQNHILGRIFLPRCNSKFHQTWSLAGRPQAEPLAGAATLVMELKFHFKIISVPHVYDE